VSLTAGPPRRRVRAALGKDGRLGASSERARSKASQRSARALLATRERTVSFH